LWSGAIGVVLWLPPLIQQFTSSDGNLTALARFFLRPGSQHGLSDGLLHAALQLTLVVRAVFDPVTIRTDGHQGLALAVVAAGVALAIALSAAIAMRSTDLLVLFLMVGAELAVGISSVTRVAGGIQYYLVEWISAVGLVFWIACGGAAITWVRERVRSRVWPRAVTFGVALLLAGLVCAGAITAYPHGSRAENEGLVYSANQDLLASPALDRILRATRHDHTVVLRLDDEAAWEILAADALALEQHGTEVRILESPVTRLLFDDGRLVRTAAGFRVLAFRDRGGTITGPRGTAIARQGRWWVAQVRGPAGG
jgi:hypothetical protein